MSGTYVRVVEGRECLESLVSRDWCPVSDHVSPGRRRAEANRRKVYHAMVVS